MLKFVYFCHKEFVGSLKLMLICYVIFYSFFYILADHPKANEYYSDPRLAAYAVPYAPILSCTDAAKNSLRREVEILKSKPHWSKAYFYLWDEPLNVEQYDMICNISNELRSYSPDVRILTTYYCGEYKTKPDVVSR